MKNIKENEVKIVFNISLTIFVTWAKKMLNYIRRDLEEFIKYGLTDEKLTELELLVKTFGDIPTDEELLGIQMQATKEKEEAAVALRLEIIAIMTRAANKFGIDTPQYRRFGVSGVSNLDNGELSTICRRVHRVALSFLSELASEGLTNAILTGFKTKMEVFDEKLGMQEDAISDRDIATNNRIRKANEIYRQIAKLSVTGKSIWQSENEAKYNDYVIYDTPTGAPEVNPRASEEDVNGKDGTT
jgi:hypothetical protein